MTLPAPPRLSITICWPRLSLIFGATMRAMMSVLPPGANGTIRRTGRTGYVCANASGAAAIARPHATRSDSRQNRFLIDDASLHVGKADAARRLMPRLCWDGRDVTARER